MPTENTDSVVLVNGFADTRRPDLLITIIVLVMHSEAFFAKLQ